MNSSSDETLLKELSEGSASAFDDLYLLYAPRVESFAYAMLKNRDDAEDLTHDIFLKIWNQRKKISEIKSFKAYLFGMVKNAVYNLYEHKVIQSKYMEQYTYDISDLLSEDVSDKLVYSDLLMFIHISLEKMPLLRKQIFKLNKSYGLNSREIAEKLQMSQKTVEYNLKKTIEELRVEIKSLEK